MLVNLRWLARRGGGVHGHTHPRVERSRGPTSHERTVTLELRRHLVARGGVQVADGFDDCAIDVRVNIQRLRSGTWRTIDSDQTNDDGIYREPIPDRGGRYRAVAVREELNAGRTSADATARRPGGTSTEGGGA